MEKLLSASVVGMIGGIYLAGRMRKDATMIAKSSGLGLAIRAVSLSTLISLSSLGLATASVAKYLNVSSFKEFGIIAKEHLAGLIPPGEDPI